MSHSILASSAKSSSVVLLPSGRDCIAALSVVQRLIEDYPELSRDLAKYVPAVVATGVLLPIMLQPQLLLRLQLPLRTT